MMPELVRKYAAPVPRYTGYPTAPPFSTDIGPEFYARWLATDLAHGPVSLYLHIPFCKSLCWYCGCNTKATRRYEPIARYLAALHDEMGLLQKTVGHSPTISHVHIGGGSPDILAPDDIRRLDEAIRQHFDLSSRHEFAVEIDPRNANTARIEAFAKIGTNRVSFGVQNFDRDAQQAINRHQSYEETLGAVEAFREAGVSSINIDLIFGLPKQRRETVQNTVGRVLEIKPDRIALCSYAHLLNRISHQRMINSEDLPGTIERFTQANRAASLLTAAGYVRIGLDHFTFLRSICACFDAYLHQSKATHTSGI
ncbi:MAG: radical SAM protein [Pseudomonadota bacterium]